jgi:hypothetical protein
MFVPETVVIGVLMHGEIHFNKHNAPNKEPIPDNMSIHIVNAVAPGVPNISTIEIYEEMSEETNKMVNTIKEWDKLTNKELIGLTSQIRDSLVQTNKEQSEDIIRCHQQMYRTNNVLDNFQKFAHNYDNSFRITSYNSGDFIPDKLFLKFSEGELINPNNFPENHFNKMVMYNVENQPDLFDILKEVGLNIEEITLSQLMEFLNGIGTKNIILVDLSCSVFKSESLTDYDIRRTRRQMLVNSM